MLSSQSHQKKVLLHFSMVQNCDNVLQCYVFPLIKCIILWLFFVIFSQCLNKEELLKLTKLSVTSLYWLVSTHASTALLHNFQICKFITRDTNVLLIRQEGHVPILCFKFRQHGDTVVDMWITDRAFNSLLSWLGSWFVGPKANSKWNAWIIYITKNTPCSLL